MQPLLRGEQELALVLPPPAKEQRRRGAVSSAGAAAAVQDDDPLLVALKAWRREQAREQGVPPYVVFHDRTLMELAATRPSNQAELSGISGVGSAKLKRYGAALLEVLATANA